MFFSFNTFNFIKLPRNEISQISHQKPDTIPSQFKINVPVINHPTTISLKNDIPSAESKENWKETNPSSARKAIPSIHQETAKYPRFLPSSIHSPARISV